MPRKVFKLVYENFPRRFLFTSFEQSCFDISAFLCYSLIIYYKQRNQGQRLIFKVSSLKFHQQTYFIKTNNIFNDDINQKYPCLHLYQVLHKPPKSPRPCSPFGSCSLMLPPGFLDFSDSKVTEKTTASTKQICSSVPCPFSPFGN